MPKLIFAKTNYHVFFPPHHVGFNPVVELFLCLTAKGFVAHFANTYWSSANGFPFHYCWWRIFRQTNNTCVSVSYYPFLKSVHIFLYERTHLWFSSVLFHFHLYTWHWPSRPMVIFFRNGSCDLLWRYYD